MAISRSGTVLRLQDKIPLTESVPCTIGHINFGKKVLGERSAGNPHAAFDVAGAGNGELEFTAPVLDPTGEENQRNSSTTLWLLLDAG